MKTLIFIHVLFIFFSPICYGKIHLFYQTSYITQEFSSTVGSSESVSKETRTPSDIKLGKELNNNIFLGLNYHNAITTIENASDTIKYTRNGYGPIIGYHFSKYFLHATYYLNMENDRNGDILYQKGTGFQIDFGWIFKLGSIVSLTPEITYRSLSYKERITGSADPVELDSSADGEMIPQIGVNLAF